MISFYPGPSKLYPEVRQYLEEAYDSGLLSLNHRSDQFTALSKECISTLKSKLNIPNDYAVYFTSSATEGWETTLQSLVKYYSFHCFNGAFGQRWFELAQTLIPKVGYTEFGISEGLNVDKIDKETELVCLTQNETSNGTQLPLQLLKTLRKVLPDALIALDVTSSIGGIALDFSQGDIWLASVQKCLGLPAGLGLMVCSPAAIARAKELNRCHYNNLWLMHQRMLDWQTTHTPSVLHIYLLGKVAQQIPVIKETSESIIQAANNYYTLFRESKTVKLLINGERPIQSDTVVTISGNSILISKIKMAALKQGLLLGNGYGVWKENTFRIANFPAISNFERVQLMAFLATYI